MKNAKNESSLTNKLLVVAITVGLVAIVLSSYAILNPRVVTIIKNATPAACTQIPLECMTHQQIFQQLQNPNASFGLPEYAAADFYVALVCKTLSNAAPVCTLPAIQAFEKSIVSNSTTALNISGYNITGALITPSTSYSDAPVITKNETFTKRLTDINEPLNSSELAVINNAPDSYYEKAGGMYLNHTLNVSIGALASKLPLFMVNGKPTVIYLGSITCVFCGENRWAMAMALSRFGSFSYLFKGYSSVGDADLPTLYWTPAHYNSSSTTFGSFYSSSYINFLAIEDTNPISGGFNLNSLSTIQQRANQTNNQAYIDAMKYILSTKGFSGTPYTVWGAYQVGGADAVVLGT
jgi:hypothetical protein